MNVSTVIPTYNRRAYIRRAIDSVLAQSLPVEEIIIVDDERSTDGLSDAVANWYGSNVRVVKEGGGLSGARKRCVREARGEWIAFLDSDDDWTPDRNRLLLEAASRVPVDVAWIFGNMRTVTDSGEGMSLYEEFGLQVDDSVKIFADPLEVQFPFQFGLLQGSFIRRSVLLELDCFSEGLQHSEDLYAGFQVACRYRFAAIPNVVGRYFRTSDLASNSAMLKGLQGADYYRSRMMCFAEVINSGRRRPWNLRYAAAARELARVIARQGQSPRSVAIRQFRFGGISAKGIAYLCFASFGRAGSSAWDYLAGVRRRLFQRE